MLLLYIAAFISGLFVDGTAVFWVHYSERKNAAATAFFAALQAIAQVIGIGESIHDWRVAAFFIAGYAAGAGIAVKLKNLLK